MAKEAKKIGKEARIVYATSEGTKVAASEKAVDKLIKDVEKDADKTRLLFSEGAVSK